MDKKRGEESSSVNRLMLKRAANKKIDSMLSKSYITEKEVYEAIRSFFKKHLEVDYEFTHTELMDELKKIYLSEDLKKRVHSLFERISEFEHNSREFKKEELEEILQEFKTVVDEMIVVHYDKHENFFTKIMHFIHHIFSRKHETMLDDINEEEFFASQRHVVKMNMLLDNAKRMAEKNNLEEAKKFYKELNEIYTSLDENKKQAYYKPVSELFQIIKSKG
jgi:hypothetical protein